MRAALLIAVLFAPMLSARSPGPRPYDRLYAAGDGQFVYVQLDTGPDIVRHPLSPFAGYKDSGLYRRDDPTTAIWVGSIGINAFGPAPVFSADGEWACVLHDSESPQIEFFFRNQLVRSWTLSRPAERFGRKQFDYPESRTRPFMSAKLWDSFVTVSTLAGDEYTFILRSGQLVRRQYSRQIGPNVFATDQEMSAFEASLAGGIEKSEVKRDESADLPSSERLPMTQVPPPLSTPAPIGAVAQDVSDSVGGRGMGRAGWILSAVASSLILVGIIALLARRRRP
jgi:hypothetical protein